jgi:tetratricopeptide (TPR) repeat protein
MGSVYKAWDKELERTVALKLIRHDLTRDPSISQRFKQELLLASKISHRNVLRIHDLGDGPGGTKFISMACVEGPDLHQLLKREGRLPLERALKIACQLCAALDAAHAEGVVHRDLKPQNILLDQHDHVYVSDFGLAKSLESDLGMTRTGQFLGTPRYMSPEQAEIKPVDHRSDLYAFGLILCELMTGALPFDRAQSTMQIMYQRVHEPPKDPKRLNPDLPDYLARIVRKCLERDVAQRYQSAGEILADLDAGRPPEVSLRSRYSHAVDMLAGGRRKWIPAALAAVLVLAVIQIVVEPRFRHGPAPQHPPVSVLVADFKNETGDPIFEGTLEPAFGVALEGASFITGYNRSSAHRLAARIQPGAVTLDDTLARLVATREGINVVVSGDISRRGDEYDVQVRALDPSTGKALVTAEEITRKDDVLLTIGKLAARVRKRLGDTTPESAQIAAAETFTSKSLDAAHEYAVAQALHFAGNWNDALEHYRKAAELNPDMGRAYVGMANCYYNTGQTQQAKKYYQTALSHLDGMSEREKYRTRGAYYLLVRDSDKAIEQQLQLVKQYPSDNAGLANLALAYFFRRDMQKALEEGRKAIAIYPQNVAQRNNVGLYAMYAGDFEAAIKEQNIVLQQNPSFVLGYVGTALSELGEDHPDQARQTFEKAATLGGQGASAAAAGLADVALYEGRTLEAIGILEKGVEADVTAKNPDGAGTKLAILAQAALQKGNTRRALEATAEALQQSKGTGVVFWAARAYIGANQPAKALGLARQLAKELEPDPQAYAKLIEGEVELKSGKPRDAIELFLESRKIADTWMSRFDAGRAYVDAGAFAEAESELDACMKRRGEATALFLDENPTYFVFPPVYYYLGRAQEGLKSPAAGDSYNTFLQIKEKAEPDPLVADARRRVGG